MNIAFGHKKFTHYFVTRDGTNTSMTLWNPTSSSIAKMMECDEECVDFYEDESGDEIVTVNGREVGKVEWL